MTTKKNHNWSEKSVAGSIADLSERQYTFSKR